MEKKAWCQEPLCCWWRGLDAWLPYTLGNQKAERMGLEAGLGYDPQRPLVNDLCYQLDPTDSKDRAPAVDHLHHFVYIYIQN